MKLVTTEQMRRIERRAVEAGIPTILLMEHAGRAVAQVAHELLRSRGGGRVLVVCGKGNNGGDGLCAARHLQNAGVPVRVMLLARDQDLSGDALSNLRIARAAGIEVDNVVGPVDTGLRAVMGSYQLLVDAIFGTGFRGPAVGLPARAIEALNGSGVPVLSVDVPSGLEVDTGRIDGPCVRAAATVTLGFPKVGMVVYPGAEFCGRITVADLGIPRVLVEDLEIRTELATAAQVRTFLPPRAPDTHKGNYGRVLLVGGSTWFSGAPRLMALGALRAGAGLVRLVVPESIYPAVASAVVEAMPLGLPDEAGVLRAASLQTLLELVQEADVVGMGPGMTTRGDIPHLVREVLHGSPRPVVLDADGLNVLAGHPETLREARAPVVITPHPGELGRLLGVSAAEIQRGRLHAAQSASRRTGAVTVLKGARTVVAEPNGRLVVIPTGNPGMATGGMGDVLTGVIAALIAQGLGPFDAAWVGACRHGAAGDLVAASVGDRGLLAREVADAIPVAIRRIQEGTLPEPVTYLHAVCPN